MFRFIHSADWQLGARFAQFSSEGMRLREARITTLRRTLDLATTHEVAAFLIAGDLFEDNQVDDILVTAALDLFRGYPALPIYILPGNHDPFTGPDSVWQRKAFQNASANVHVLCEASATPLDSNVYLVASPLHQKLSTTDPSLKLVELAAQLPPDAIKIGITHGALAIEAKHQPNDFPIALNAASRAGLDYLAIGHWHNWLSDTDSGRIVMPGTPEPDRFTNANSGHVALVEISGSGQPPRVQPSPVATLNRRVLTFDFSSAEASRASLTKAELQPDFDKLPDRTKRAATALQQIANELQTRRSVRDEAKGKLETLGDQGLYSRETELEEKKAVATLRRDAARNQAWCTRLAHDLIEHLKQAATKAVLTPLEQRLTLAFAELTGDTTREVFLDERLQVAGIGRNRESAHSFDQLSQGAKEQLLLCLRLAVAQELAVDEPHVLILDDVLVNTDPVRQERILDVLGAQAARIQILILTCHPDRFRGIGHPISFCATP